MNQPDQNHQTHFGYRQVDEQQKESLVKGVFDSVANHYDIMNDFMSLGIHRIWKHQTVMMANVAPDAQCLDLAGGTGDMTARLVKHLGTNGHIILSDINETMLNEGKKRLANAGLAGHKIDYVVANAEALPFDDNRFDLVTMAFGLRNVTHKDKALAEICRVLKPGGKAMILEFSTVTHPTISKLYDAFSFDIIPKIGKYVAKDEDAYRYLAESIRMHPDQQTLKQMMDEAGFDVSTYTNMTFGVVALHQGYKVAGNGENHKDGACHS